MTDPTGVDAVARGYVEAVGRGDLAPLEELLDHRMRATFAGTVSTKSEWITALRRLLPVLVRNDIREVIVEGDRACVVYDFVTDTAAGAVRCIELLTISAGRIKDVELILDRVAFAPVGEELERRAAG